MDPQADFPHLVDETREIWEHNARWWDAQMGEGNKWHNTLIAPATEKLLAVRTGERVLEIACGNGQFARRLADLGAIVVACDFSQSFLDCARSRAADNSSRIEYRLLDTASEQQMAELGAAQFDAAVCNMALMDIACITPVFRAVRRALKPEGRFVFSIPHPSFNTNGTTLIAERDDYDGPGTVTFGIRVTRYRTLEPQKAVGIPGQPLPHYYFHRSLSTLLSAAFTSGFVLDGLEEPVFDEDSTEPYTLRWTNCREIPPVLVARLRLAGF